MTIRKIKKLAEASYTDNHIDKKAINKISLILKGKELKFYVKALKNFNKRNTVEFYVPSKKMVTDDMIKSISNFFKNKIVNLIEEPSLIAGARIIDNDMIYELNLKDSLENLIDHIQKSYD